jgi:hypothetical protein
MIEKREKYKKEEIGGNDSDPITRILRMSDCNSTPPNDTF